MGDQLHFSTRQSSCIISRARFRPRFPASLNGIAASARIGAFECVILGRQRRAAYNNQYAGVCARVSISTIHARNKLFSCIDVLRRALSLRPINTHVFRNRAALTSNLQLTQTLIIWTWITLDLRC